MKIQWLANNILRLKNADYSRIIRLKRNSLILIKRSVYSWWSFWKDGKRCVNILSGKNERFAEDLFSTCGIHCVFSHPSPFSPLHAQMMYSTPCKLYANWLWFWYLELKQAPHEIPILSNDLQVNQKNLC